MNEKKWMKFLTSLGSVVVLAVFFVVGICVQPSLAQDAESLSSAIKSTPSTWRKRCVSNEPDAYCEISFGKLLKFKGQTSWRSVAGIFERGDKRDLFVFTPLGTALRNGLRYRVDAHAPQAAEYSVCLQLQGCQAIVEASDDLVSKMKKGNELLVMFTLGSRPPIGSSVSLSGFTAAYDGTPSDIIQPSAADNSSEK